MYDMRVHGPRPYSGLHSSCFCAHASTFALTSYFALYFTLLHAPYFNDAREPIKEYCGDRVSLCFIVICALTAPNFTLFTGVVLQLSAFHIWPQCAARLTLPPLLYSESESCPHALDTYNISLYPRPVSLPFFHVHHLLLVNLQRLYLSTCAERLFNLCVV